MVGITKDVKGINSSIFSATILGFTSADNSTTVLSSPE